MKSHLRILSILLLISIFSYGVQTSAQALRPRLVIGITVEGLDKEYLDMLAGHFAPDGFKRLINGGMEISNLDFGSDVDAAAATAIIYTGAPAAFNGIPSAYLFDVDTRTPVNSLLDTSVLGNFTADTFSPRNIAVSTLADELVVDTDGRSSVYAIAPSEHQAIISGGHAASSAAWMSIVNGNWATSTYYKHSPAALSTHNYKKPLSARIDTIAWSPLLSLATYPLIGDSKKSFRYTFGKKDVDRYRNFSRSALANTEVTDLAIEYIKSLRLGMHDAPDMLALTYCVAPYTAGNANSRMATFDVYLRLDRDLMRLMKAADNAVGHNSTMIFLVGIPTEPSAPAPAERYRIPGGEFSVKRATSLLNMYLMAMYGNGDWVAGYHNRSFYLNHKLIKERDLDLQKMRTQAAEFLARMSGISGVYTIDDVAASRAGSNPDALKRNTSMRHAGDVIVTVNPGWSITDLPGSSATVARYNRPDIPAFILAPGLKPQKITGSVDARAIAPTISRILHIPAPNGASVPAI